MDDDEDGFDLDDLVPDAAEDQENDEQAIRATIRRDRRAYEAGRRLFIANLEHYEMADQTVAEMFWIRYKALVKVGFRPDQAFRLLIRFGIDSDL